MWLSGVRTQPSIREDAGLIPCLSQWVKDPALLQAVTWIPCGCGCGVGRAEAPIQPLAKKLSFDEGADVKRKKKKSLSVIINLFGLRAPLVRISEFLLQLIRLQT